MGQKFAAHDSDGHIIGFFDDRISPVPKGQDAIEITDEEWAAALTSQAHRVHKGKLVAPTPPTAAERLAQVQAQLCAAINMEADLIYSQLGVTSPGRLAEYQQAKMEAVAFQSAGFKGTAPPSVAVWAEANHITARVAATRIIATAKAWDKRMAAVRSARILGKGKVMVAASEKKAQAAADIALGQLRAILTWPHDVPTT